MEKKIIALAFSCSLFQLSYCMDGTFASFKDVVLGKKRDIQEEINYVKSDTSLTALVRARQLGKLYGELRNKYRGKDEYAEYNNLMCRFNKIALEIEQQEQEVDQHLKKQAARNAKESKLKEHLEKITSDGGLSSLAKCEAKLECYAQLKALFDGINKEKYNLYENSRGNIEQKKSLLILKASLEQNSNKSENVKTLRKISALCMKPVRAQKYRDRAEALEKEEKYDELVALASQSANLLQKAKLHRVMMYYSEDRAAENLAIAKQLEDQAEKERLQDEALNEKMGKITGLNMEIATTDANKDKKLTHYDRLKTLAELVEQRWELSQDVPHFKSQFTNDLTRVQKLRLEAIGYAKNETERGAMIALLKY